MATSHRSIKNIPKEIVSKALTNFTIGEGGCMVWAGNLSKNGYGKMSLGGESLLVHRVSYEHSVGPIEIGMVIDHLCRNRACINPDHLDQCTIGENVMRGDTIGARNKAATHCKRGHEFTEANTVYLTRGGRVCKTCAYAANKKVRDAKDKSEIAAKHREWRKANRDHVKKKAAEYYLANREREKARARERYHALKEASKITP